MAYQGYLVKVGIHIVDKYMAHGSYSSTPNMEMDLASYRDANGDLKRNILNHKKTTFEFTTPYLRLADKQALQAMLPSRTKLTVTYWNDETNTYTTGDFYIPNVKYEVYSQSNTDILYKPINFQFIQY